MARKARAAPPKDQAPSDAASAPTESGAAASDLMEPHEPVSAADTMVSGASLSARELEARAHALLARVRLRLPRPRAEGAGVGSRPNSAASHDSVGSLDLLRQILAIQHALVYLDPENVDRQFRLFWTYGQIADVLIESGDHAAAFEARQMGHDIISALAAGEPSNVGFRHNLGISYSKISALLPRLGHSGAGFDALLSALDIASKLSVENPNNRRLREALKDYQERVDLITDNIVSGRYRTTYGEHSDQIGRRRLAPTIFGYAMAGDRDAEKEQRNVSDIDLNAAATPPLEWPVAGWQKLREEGGLRKHHAIVDYLLDTWKSFLDLTGATVTLEILEQKDPGAGTALRRYLERHPMPEGLRFIQHDDVMRTLAERPTRLVDAASCRQCKPAMQ